MLLLDDRGALGEFFVRREQQDTMTNRECPESTNSSGHGKGKSTGRSSILDEYSTAHGIYFKDRTDLQTNQGQKGKARLPGDRLTLAS